MCACAHLSACVHESTSGSGLQAGYAALKGCVSAAISFFRPPSAPYSHSGSLFHVAASFTAPPVLHYPCLIVIDFKGQGKMMEECLIHALPHPEPYAIEEGSWLALHNKAIYAATLVAHNHPAV